MPSGVVMRSGNVTVVEQVMRTDSTQDVPFSRFSEGFEDCSIDA